MDTEMINDKVSQGIMLISAEKYDAAKLLLEDIIAEAPRTREHIFILEMHVQILESTMKRLNHLKKHY